MIEEEKYPEFCRQMGRGGVNDTNVPWPPRSPDLTSVVFILWGFIIPWPPRSPDLTPMDFILQGYIKKLVYTKNYQDLDQLKNAIVAAFQLVAGEMVTSALANFVKRLNLVVEANGCHIEQ